MIDHSHLEKNVTNHRHETAINLDVVTDATEILNMKNFWLKSVNEEAILNAEEAENEEFYLQNLTNRFNNYLSSRGHLGEHFSTKTLSSSELQLH